MGQGSETSTVDAKTSKTATVRPCVGISLGLTQCLHGSNMASSDRRYESGIFAHMDVGPLGDKAPLFHLCRPPLLMNCIRILMTWTKSDLVVKLASIPLTAKSKAIRANTIRKTFRQHYPIANTVIVYVSSMALLGSPLGHWQQT
jgi:hypothetical protein